ncbi:DNA repair protein RecN [Myxococcota bacterium]|nr:DNA repair protein RecN [Myxococcota bacterium]
MLLHLKVRDFAIIQRLDIDFLPGFSVITGETGAGKSIVVGALNIILGGRASTDLIRDGADQAEVEALFDIAAHSELKTRLQSRELMGDDPDILLVRRVLRPSGRGKVVINGRLSTAATLKEVTRSLVDISGQHEQQSLLNTDNHIQILDNFGNLQKEKNLVGEHYKKWREALKQRKYLEEHETEALQRADFIRFQLDEIARVDPQANEDSDLESELSRLTHADKLKAGATTTEQMLYAQDNSAFDLLSRAILEVEALVRLDESMRDVVVQLESAVRETQEAAREVQSYANSIELDPQRLGEVELRLEELRRLKRKHGGTLEEALSRETTLRKELESIEHSDERLIELRKIEASHESALLDAAQRLSQKRQKAARALTQAAGLELADMDLKGAELIADIADLPQGGSVLGSGININEDGKDNVEFLWNANAGESAKPLAKIASGGELSRLMLAVKRVMAKNDMVSLYVFDEVDAGIGGRAADAIGRKIQAVADGHQAIVITHLAPIAARAEHHLSVRKEQKSGRTLSIIESLEGDRRRDEIARMIDGAHLNKATQEAALEMLKRGRSLDNK